MQTIYSGSHPEPGVVVFPSQREPDVEQGATPPSRAQDVVAEVETAERKCDPSQEHPLDEGKLSAWDTVYLALQVTPFALLYVVMFSELGYGATVFKALARSAGAKTFASIGVFVLLLLYVLDAWKWKSSFLQWFRRFSLAVSVFAAFMNLVLSIHTRPWSPLYAYILANILWCAWRRELWYKHVHPARYIASCALVIVTVGVLLLALNLAWAAQTNLWWGKATRQEFRERLRVCQPSFRAPDGSAWCRHYGHGGSACPNGCPELTWASACDPQDDTCLAAFLLYAGPFIVGVTCLLLGTALHVVAMAALPALPPPALQEVASADNQPSLRPNPTPKILVHGLLLCLIGLWLAASIGGASMELSHVFSSLLLLSLATLLAAIVRTFGLDQQLLEQGAMVIIDTKSPSHRVQTADDLDEHDQAAASVAAHSAPSGLVGMVVAVLRSDWVKALCLMTTASFLPFLLALSALKQAVRRWLAPHTQHGDHFSGLGNNILSVLGRWEWGSVLSKTVVLGAVYFVVQVGVLRLTTLALSWLNQHLAGQNLALISLLLYIVGIILLLIPAVPGVPVYLACGVILGAAGTEELGTFGAAMFWAVIVAFVTKMSGSAIQQVVIGGWAGRMVWVRAACKVNSRGIKAMRIILSKPGLTRDKMYILVGGPDWPTSVLTGILGLKVSQMFVGALPIIVPITFVVVSGGCLNYGASDGKWASLSTVFLTVSSATLGSCFFAAVLAIEETAAQCDAEIRAMPDDQEVKALEQTMAEDEKLVGLAMKWSEQSRFERVLLVMAAVVMYMSTAAFVLLSDLCFQTVDLATRFEGPPLYGRISNLIRAPHGWMAMALHVYASRSVCVAASMGASV